jgi:hypothetical protein
LSFQAHHKPVRPYGGKFSDELISKFGKSSAAMHKKMVVLEAVRVSHLPTPMDYSHKLPVHRKLCGPRGTILVGLIHCRLHQ